MGLRGNNVEIGTGESKVKTHVLCVVVCERVFVFRGSSVCNCSCK